MAQGPHITAVKSLTFHSTAALTLNPQAPVGEPATKWGWSIRQG
jgi:hypothetical protein